MQIGIRERKVLIVLAIVFFVAVVLPGFLSLQAIQYRQGELDRRQALQTGLIDTGNKRKDVAEQKVLYDSYLESYQLWLERGVAAETADKTAWRNIMYDIKQIRDFGVIDFSFGEVQRVPPEESAYTEDSNVSIEVIPMFVSMPMLHDMDIFMFLGDLAKRSNGIFVPMSCEMTRLEYDFSTTLRDNMTGKCEIAWIFVDDPERGNAGGGA